MTDKHDSSTLYQDLCIYCFCQIIAKKYTRKTVNSADFLLMRARRREFETLRGLEERCLPQDKHYHLLVLKD